MKDKTNHILQGLAWGFILGALLFFSIGTSIGEDFCKEQAVKEGHGYYDPTTREFKFGRLGNE